MIFSHIWSALLYYLYSYQPVCAFIHTINYECIQMNLTFDLDYKKFSKIAKIRNLSLFSCAQPKYLPLFSNILCEYMQFSRNFSETCRFSRIFCTNSWKFQAILRNLPLFLNISFNFLKFTRNSLEITTFHEYFMYITENFRKYCRFCQKYAIFLKKTSVFVQIWRKTYRFCPFPTMVAACHPYGQCDMSVRSLGRRLWSDWSKTDKFP